VIYVLTRADAVMRVLAVILLIAVSSQAFVLPRSSFVSLSLQSSPSDPVANDPSGSKPIFSGFGHAYGSQPQVGSPAPAFSGFSHAITPPPPTTSSAPVPEAAPVFSGFGHASGQQNNGAPAPVFSGFGHATGQQQDMPAAPAAPAVFSVFGHSINGATRLPAAAPTPAPAPAFSGFGHATGVRNDVVMSDQKAAEEPTSAQDLSSNEVDLGQAGDFLRAAREKVSHLRDQLKDREEQHRALVQKLNDELA
jgi:hypothetical protein